MEERAILVVDMIPGCIHERGHTRDQPELRRQISGIQQLLLFAEERGIPTFLVEYPPYGSTIEQLRRCVENPTIVSKYAESVFYDTKLHQELQRRETRILAVTGINASACVHSITVDARRLGFDVVTSLDLITDFEYDTDVCQTLGIKISKPFKNSKLGYYRENTNFFDSYEEVMEYLSRPRRKY